MHGTIFTLLKRYVQTQYGHSTWVRLLELAGLEHVDFNHKTVYPDSHMYALIGRAAEMTGRPAGELHEKFGEHLVPDTLHMYQKLVRPEWKTPDMLEHTELTMHRQVRQEHIENVPPVLGESRLGPNELLIDYVSARRLGGLAVGIVRGLATYFDAADRIDVQPTPTKDGERVRIHARRR